MASATEADRATPALYCVHAGGRWAREGRYTTARRRNTGCGEQVDEGVGHAGRIDKQMEVAPPAGGLSASPLGARGPPRIDMGC
jgi:hypothetical protein